MQEENRQGKAGKEFMDRIVYRSLGSPSKRLKVGPARGLDNAVVTLGDGRVLVLTVDPVSIIPAVGMKLSAWLSVHLIASDLVTSGVRPEFATFSYNFPPELTLSEREEYVRSMGDECDKLRVTIVAGNTGTYPGGAFTVIGAGTMFGVGAEEEYVTPAMARAGDTILVTKHAAIEATASLSMSFPRYLARKTSRSVLRKASSMIGSCTTVDDALTAKKAGLGRGGVTSMHDATEGGVLGALEEMATASNKAFEVGLSSIPVSAEATEVCAAFGIDPLKTMGEGALLITCNPARVPELSRAMLRANIPIREIGTVSEGEGLLVEHSDGRVKRFEPAPDKYWRAYERATRLGLD